MQMKHWALMLAGCLVAFGAAAAILWFQIPSSQVLIGLVILLCPLSHLLMMRFMGHQHGTGHRDQQHAAKNPTVEKNAGR